MRAKSILKVYRSLAKELIGVEPIIEFDEEFAFDRSTSKIYIPMEVIRDEYEDMIDEYFSNKGITFSNYIIGFLHELGHYYSDKSMNLTGQDYFDASIINMAIEKKVNESEIGFLEALELYYSWIPLEKFANDFLYDVVKNHYHTINRYNKMLSQYYE